MGNPRGRALAKQWLHSATLEHAVRTAVSAVLSLLTAQVCGLPETYWAAITTLIVMQSSMQAVVLISVRRLMGTALGAAGGALLVTYFGPSVLFFGIGIFLLGVLCELLGKVHARLPQYLDRTAFRYSSITMAIVMLIPHRGSPYLVGLHRFIEVSIGIVVALVVTSVWPERCVAAPDAITTAEE
jgi:uncharacterized membrane protein YgaE (UPF0421/DUF939 family)